MTKRRTIGDNPLDAVIPRASIAPPVVAKRPEKVGKRRMTINIPAALIDQVKNAIFWTPGLTVAQFAEDAFRSFLEKMEKKHGKPFPRRKGRLRIGRPLN